MIRLVLVVAVCFYTSKFFAQESRGGSTLLSCNECSLFFHLAEKVSNQHQVFEKYGTYCDSVYSAWTNDGKMFRVSLSKELSAIQMDSLLQAVGLNEVDLELAQINKNIVIIDTAKYFMSECDTLINNRKFKLVHNVQNLDTSFVKFMIGYVRFYYGFVVLSIYHADISKDKDLIMFYFKPTWQFNRIYRRKLIYHNILPYYIPRGTPNFTDGE
jgi:hypothetical protein